MIFGGDLHMIITKVLLGGQKINKKGVLKTPTRSNPEVELSQYFNFNVFITLPGLFIRVSIDCFAFPTSALIKYCIKFSLPVFLSGNKD